MTVTPKFRPAKASSPQKGASVATSDKRPLLRDIYTIAECMVRKLVQGWLLFLIAVGVGALLVVSFQTGPEDIKEVLTKCRENGILVTTWTSLLLVIIAGSMELPREVQSETILFLLAKPILRRDIVLGKLAGLLVVGFAFVLLQTVVSVTVIGIRGLGPDWRFTVQTVLILARVSILASAVILFSTSLPEFQTIFLSAMYLGLGCIMYLLDALLVSGYLHWSVNWVFRFSYYFAPNFSILSLSGLSGYRAPVPFVIHAVGYAASYSMLLTLAALFVFRKREFGRI
ncbi:MAG: hypothetical protein A3K19_07230 [Lentisphaerae bacterium RIFOXYB12_FULL_65_16]|nr:MAG: hypothetical protein A3K18_07100 [Lentisphaerae bacterium RIFOXYA12_64_32]OGV93314.1 MAG: hypothetical protein A3K19_07230 [Lentisphaerae bacterium RIFOXYB12_FULL_65_16]